MSERTAGDRVAWVDFRGKYHEGTVEFVGNGSTKNGDPLLLVFCDDGWTRHVRESNTRGEATETLF